MTTLEETVYRPPLEAGSGLLEISLGCSYGRCAFCQYSDGKTPLQLVPSEILCENLKEAASAEKNKKRYFLTGGNVLAFRERYILDIFRLVRNYLPEVSEFAMYARADDVLRKGLSQLKELRGCGLKTLYIGVESGNAKILRLCRKGETPEEIVQALHLLDEAGISYGLSSILGLGGMVLSRDNALDTAALYNSVSPASIRVMTLTPMKGTPLDGDVKSGNFRLLTERRIIEEEVLLLESITLSEGGCFFIGTHISNAVPIEGKLPGDKRRMLSELHTALLSDAACGVSGGAVSKW